MAKQTVVLTVEQEETIEQHANMVEVGGRKYFFIPYWFEKTDKPGKYILHSLEHSLPAQLEEVIKSNRK